MQQLIFDLEDNKDARLLIEIANKLGIRKYRILKTNIVKKTDKDKRGIMRSPESDGDSPLVQKADSTVDISDLQKLFTGKEFNAGQMRESLWHR